MTEPVRPRLSATVLLARDGADGIELFMVVRHHQIDFASGALVFPGGSLDPGDRDPRLRTLADGVDDIDDNVLAVRVAAAREAFEECGVLFARTEGSDTNRRWSTERLPSAKKYRSKLEANAVGLADIAEAEGLRLCLDQLHHFAHWITPVHMPKRFDTHFFLARAPADHHLVHDGSEAVDSVWIQSGSGPQGCRRRQTDIGFRDPSQYRARRPKSGPSPKAIGRTDERPDHSGPARRGEDG